jgi:hypothetical protein
MLDGMVDRTAVNSGWTVSRQVSIIKPNEKLEMKHEYSFAYKRSSKIEFELRALVRACTGHHHCPNSQNRNLA